MTNAGFEETANSCTIPFYNILWAELLQSKLIIEYASLSNGGVRPVTLQYSVDPKRQPVSEWIAKLLNRSYADSQRMKRAKVLVNPHSGRGLAKRWFSKDIEPLLRAARCSVDVVETKHAGDGMNILEQLEINEYDVVVVCSGDGLAHEVFNGLGKRQDARMALTKIAVAHIPCGSGNGLSHNLNDTGNPSKATLAVIKGLRKPLDLISITQGDRRSLSFLSQAMGVAAESDLATEHLRWMGDNRFRLGFLWRLLVKKAYPADIAVKVAIEGKGSIMDHYEKEIRRQALEDQDNNCPRVPEGDRPENTQSLDGLPPLKYGTIKDPLPGDWADIPCDNLGNLYCGNVSLASF
jgi:sphingosine kinase